MRRTETDCDHTERADSTDADRQTNRREAEWRVTKYWEAKDKQGMSVCVCVSLCEREGEQSEDELNK